VFGVDCALLAPAKTPPEAVKWLETETLKVLKTKEIQDKLHKAGFMVRPQGADACWKRVHSEIALFKDIIEKAHIKQM
jgi:tripartite-type tricarboxylate transporter receptor subunit TctC